MVSGISFPRELVDEIAQLDTSAAREAYFSERPDLDRLALVDFLCDQVNRLLRADIESAERVVDSAGWLAELSGSKTAKGRFLRASGNVLYGKRDYRGVIEKYEAALELLEADDNTKETIRTLSNGLVLLTHLSDHKRADGNGTAFIEQNGVVCVSSVGNEGVLGMTYPSAFGVVVGVASTQNNDQITDFSNWGFGLTTLATPGEALVTTFPGGGYAAAWGTSFSSAVISGTVALLHDSNGGNMIPVNFFQAAQALIVSAKHVYPFKLGAGVVNIDKAMNCGPTGGSCSAW